MSVLIVPTSTTETSYEQITTLDGREYVLRFDWSARDESWYLSIYDQGETRLAMGLRLVVGQSLLWRETDLRLPQGILMAVDMTESGSDPGVDDLGTRVLLLYEEAA